MKFHKGAQFVFVLLIVGFIAGCVEKKEPADMVLLNGKIVTVDDTIPEAQALAVSGEKIVAVGNNEDIRAYVGQSTEVIDLEGKLAIPGFIEGHGHFTGIGRSKLNLDLMKVRNWDEVIAMVKEAVKEAKPGDWIFGRGWHQEKWDKVPSPNVEGLPIHTALSKVSPDNPIMFTHASGHASFANAKAMKLAGITKRTKAPEGGEIVRDKRGNPIGIFRERASGLFSKALRDYRAKRTPEEIKTERRKIVELAAQECLSKGITSFQDAGSGLSTVDLFKEIAEEGKLNIRLWVMIREKSDTLAKKISDYKIDNIGNLTVRGIKLSIDGALGSHGAWLLEPYTDLLSTSGLNTAPLEEVRKTARIAIENGFQLCVHAIGDRGNRETLDIFENTFKEHPDKKDLRWRIEHAQHLHPDDIPRFAGLGVIASMQGVHCTSDGPWVPKRLGDKRSKEGAYVWQKLMKSGAVVTNGTDAPVEDVSPIASFYSTVSRKLLDGSVFYPDQRMSREEALRSYTLNCAYAVFEEDTKGSLTPGKLADITVLSEDIMTIPEDDIPSTEVLYTIVGGKVMYRK